MKKPAAIIVGVVTAWTAVTVMIFADCIGRYGVEQTAADQESQEREEGSAERRVETEARGEADGGNGGSACDGHAEIRRIDYTGDKNHAEEYRSSGEVGSEEPGADGREDRRDVIEPQGSDSLPNIPSKTQEIGVNGHYLPDGLFFYLYDRLAVRGLERYAEYIVCQIWQESRFDQYCENANGLDKGLLQYRATFWDKRWRDYGFNHEYDIFNPYAQIELYIREFELRIGQGIEKALSDHYTGGEGFSAKYVNDVLHWMSFITYREMEL